MTNEILDYDLKVTDIDISDLLPNVIDNIMITMFEGFHTVVLPLNTNNLMFRNWHKKQGGVFSRDVVKFSQGKPTGKYILIHGSLLNCVARIIDDSEMDIFTALKLVDGKIQDKSFMILKPLAEGESPNSQNLQEISLEHEESDIIYDIVQHENDDFEHHTGSISLFSE